MGKVSRYPGAFFEEGVSKVGQYQADLDHRGLLELSPVCSGLFPLASTVISKELGFVVLSEELKSKVPDLNHSSQTHRIHLLTLTQD